MAWRPSLQGVVDNLFSSFLLSLVGVVGFVGAAMLTWWVQQVQQNISLPLLIILGIGVYGLIMLALNQTRAFFRKEPDKIKVVSSPVPVSMKSLESLEETIRKWLDDFHYQVQKTPVKEEKYFSFIVRGRNPNIPIEVMRTKKDRAQFVTVLGTVRISDVEKTKLDCLPERNRQLIFRKIRLELSRQKIPSSMDYSQIIALETRVLIDELTQVKLIDRIDDIDYAITLISLKFKLLLDEEEDRNKGKGIVSEASGEGLPTLKPPDKV